MHDSAEASTAGAPALAELGRLFDPRSVAIVGASADRRKWGHWLARGALAGRERRSVHLVNRRGGDILGVSCARGIDELPEVPELVALTTPAAQVPGAVAEYVEAGSCYFVVITTGVGDPPTVEAEEAVAERVREAGARLLGPNCMGLVDSTTRLNLSWGDFPSGSVGLVSQSGNVGLECGRLLARVGLGFSRFVSLGNQRGVDAAEAIEALVQHDETRLVAAYIEGFGDGRRLLRVLASAREAGKPVLMLTVGKSEPASRVAASHTGALVSATDVVAAMCCEAGAILVRTTGELVDTAQTLLATVPSRSRKVVVVGDSGGQCALAADTLADAGLALPPLGTHTVARLAAELPAQASLGNPVDLAGAGEANLASYPGVVRLLDPVGAGVTLLTGYFGDYATGTPSLRPDELAAATDLAQAARASGRAVVVHSMGRDTEVLRHLAQQGVPVFERIEQAATAVANSASWHAWSPRPPAPLDVSPAQHRMESGDYPETRALLMEHGVPFPVAHFVQTEDEARSAARAVGFPVALKAMGLAHKTESGGVALAIEDEDRLANEFVAMRARTRAESYVVEQMQRYDGSVELIVGMRRDASFGPVVLVGIGGTAAELQRDTALGLAPLDRMRARDLLEGLRHAPLLRGWRGAPAVDLTSAADVLVALGCIGLAHPEVVEIEVNPLLVHPAGAVALDAAGVLTEAPPPARNPARWPAQQGLDGATWEPYSTTIM